MSNYIVIAIILIIGGLVVGYIAAYVKMWREIEKDEHEEGGP